MLDVFVIVALVIQAYVETGDIAKGHSRCVWLAIRLKELNEKDPGERTKSESADIISHSVEALLRLCAGISCLLALACCLVRGEDIVKIIAGILLAEGGCKSSSPGNMRFRPSPTEPTCISIE